MRDRLPRPNSLTAHHATDRRRRAAARIAAASQLGGAGPRLPRAHRRRSSREVQAWAFSRPRARAGAGARRRHARKGGQGHRPAARRPGRRQGHHRHRGYADRERLRRSSRAASPTADAACVTALRRAGAVIIGKTVTTEFATFTSGQDAQPAQPRAHARRLLLRLGRGRRRRHGAARARHADRRLRHPAGRLLRRLRLQADLRGDPAHRRADAGALARHGRRLRPFGGGPGAARRRAAGP